MRRKSDGSYSCELPGNGRSVSVGGYITEYEGPAMFLTGFLNNHTFNCKAVLSNDVIYLFTEVTMVWIGGLL